MLFLLGLIAGLGAGLLTGGAWPSLAALRLRAAWVVIAALVVKEAGLLTPLARTGAAPAVYTASLLLLLGWAIWHWRRLTGAAIVASGMALNLVAVLANRGRMPVVLAAGVGSRLFRGGVFGQYVLGRSATPLVGLGDWIAVPGLPSLYSPGDLVAALGMAVVGFYATRTPAD